MGPSCAWMHGDILQPLHFLNFKMPEDTPKIHGKKVLW